MWTHCIKGSHLHTVDTLCQESPAKLCEQIEPRVPMGSCVAYSAFYCTNWNSLQTKMCSLLHGRRSVRCCDITYHTWFWYSLFSSAFCLQRDSWNILFCLIIGLEKNRRNQSKSKPWRTSGKINFSFSK